MTLSEAADRLYRESVVARKEADVSRIARHHLPKVRAFFRSQKARTLEELAKYQFLFTEDYRALREEVRPNELLTTHDWDRIWGEVDRDTFDRLQQVLAGIESEGVLKGAESVNSLLGGGGHYEGGKWVEEVPKFWDLSNPRAVRWFHEKGGSLQYIKDIQDTTRDQIKTIISTSISRGTPYTKTAKEISDRFDDISSNRARLIAVNEAAQAYEAGSFMFEEDLEADGIELEKSWENSGDDKVSDGCLENSDAGWIPLHNPFPSGHQYPPRFPGCRCWHIVRQVRK